MAANCSSGTSPPRYSWTQVSMESIQVSRSEKPNRLHRLPPSVAMLRNCTPTMSCTARAAAPWVYALRPACCSIWRRVTIAPRVNCSSVSSMASRPRRHRSMAVETGRLSILSQSIPPRMRALRFWFSCQASSRVWAWT